MKATQCDEVGAPFLVSYPYKLAIVVYIGNIDQWSTNINL